MSPGQNAATSDRHRRPPWARGQRAPSLASGPAPGAGTSGTSSPRDRPATTARETVRSLLGVLGFQARPRRFGGNTSAKRCPAALCSPAHVARTCQYSALTVILQCIGQVHSSPQVVRGPAAHWRRHRLSLPLWQSQHMSVEVQILPGTLCAFRIISSRPLHRRRWVNLVTCEHLKMTVEKEKQRDREREGKRGESALGFGGSMSTSKHKQ